MVVVLGGGHAVVVFCQVAESSFSQVAETSTLASGIVSGDLSEI